MVTVVKMGVMVGGGRGQPWPGFVLIGGIFPLSVHIVVLMVFVVVSVLIGKHWLQHVPKLPVFLWTVYMSVIKIIYIYLALGTVPSTMNAEFVVPSAEGPAAVVLWLCGGDVVSTGRAVTCLVVVAVTLCMKLVQ